MENITTQIVLIFAFALILIVAIDGLFRVNRLRKHYNELKTTTINILESLKKSVELNKQFEKMVQEDLDVIAVLSGTIIKLKNGEQHQCKNDCKHKPKKK